MSKLSEINAIRDNARKLGLKLTESQLQQLAILEEEYIANELPAELEDAIDPLLAPINQELQFLVNYIPGSRPNVILVTSAEEEEESQVAEDLPFLPKGGGYTKDPSIPFRVIFSNGTIIEEKKASQTFTKTIQTIGLSRVAGVGIYLKGYNLVSNTERPRVRNNKWQDLVDGKYIYTKLSNTVKKQYLMQISQALNLNLKIEDIK